MESGTVIAGKYRLNQRLGSGGMAEVWSATHSFTERELAIKFLNVQLAKTPEAAARFLKEAKVSARIDHPNIIDIQDVGQTEESQLFLVMELLTGFPLEIALKRQTPPMTLQEFVGVMIEVGSALEAAHKSGIVHRDLKPTNIFLHKTRDGIVMPKLLDFGVSKFLEDDQNHALTIAGTVLGSPLYMSPEQARGDSHIDGRTDIFAFGSILFEALCGYRPYEARNFNALIVKIATSKPLRIDECAPGVPESLRRVARACMEVDLAVRVGSMAEVLVMLREAARELELTRSPLRLPIPVVATNAVDPDATNAMPMIRTSEAPPRLLGSTGPSWHTPNTSYASVTVAPAKSNKRASVALALGVVMIAAIAAGGGYAWNLHTSPFASAASSPTGMTPIPPRAPIALAGRENTDTGPVSVSIDSLPRMGGGRNLLGPVPAGAGRLFVSAEPGACALVVDGKDRGLTPVAGIDLVAGAHRLECRPKSGKLRAASITVQDGATSKYKFVLDN